MRGPRIVQGTSVYFLHVRRRSSKRRLEFLTVWPLNMKTLGSFDTSRAIHPKIKRQDQQDATIRCLLLTSLSTCFGHHYAHLQENKGPITAFGVQFWFCWMWLVAVVGRCLEGCDHYESFCSTEVEQKPS